MVTVKLFAPDSINGREVSYYSSKDITGWEDEFPTSKTEDENVNNSSRHITDPVKRHEYDIRSRLICRTLRAHQTAADQYANAQETEDRKSESRYLKSLEDKYDKMGKLQVEKDKMDGKSCYSFVDDMPKGP